MRAKKDDLVSAMDRLERALDGDPVGPGRAGTVGEALAGLEQAVRRHAQVLESPDGKLIDVDRPMLPSPTVARHTAELRHELDDFLEEARALRSQFRGGTAPPGLSANPSNLAGALTVAPEAGAIPDLGVLRQRARHLLEALERYEKEEAAVILEGVTPDVGAGD